METDVYDLSEAGAVRRDLQKSGKSDKSVSLILFLKRKKGITFRDTLQI
jgi:hypothetical protein